MYLLMHPNWENEINARSAHYSPELFVKRNLLPHLGCDSNLPTRGWREEAIARVEWRKDPRTHTQRLQDELVLLSALRQQKGLQSAVKFGDLKERLAMRLPRAEADKIKEREARTRRECRSRRMDVPGLHLPL